MALCVHDRFIFIPFPCVGSFTSPGIDSRRKKMIYTYTDSQVLAVNNRCIAWSSSLYFFFKYWLIIFPMAVSRSKQTQQELKIIHSLSKKLYFVTVRFSRIFCRDHVFLTKGGRAHLHVRVHKHVLLKTCQATVNLPVYCFTNIGRIKS